MRCARLACRLHSSSACATDPVHDNMRELSVSPLCCMSVMMNAGQYMSWLRKHFEAAVACN